MFTGIVEGVGKVESLVEEKESWCLSIYLPFEQNDGLEAGATTLKYHQNLWIAHTVWASKGAEMASSRVPQL